MSKKIAGTNKIWVVAHNFFDLKRLSNDNILQKSEFQTHRSTHSVYRRLKKSSEFIEFLHLNINITTGLKLSPSKLFTTRSWIVKKRYVCQNFVFLYTWTTESFWIDWIVTPVKKSHKTCPFNQTVDICNVANHKSKYNM